MSVPSGDQISEDSHDQRQNMDLSTRPLASLVIKAFTRTRVLAEGQFHLGTVNSSGIALLTRTNSVPAKRIRVKIYSNLSSASTGKRINLANHESANVAIIYNDHIYGTPSIKITWFQKCRRYETDLSVFNIGIF